MKSIMMILMMMSVMVMVMDGDDVDDGGGDDSDDANDFDDDDDDDDDGSILVHSLASLEVFAPTSADLSAATSVLHIQGAKLWVAIRLASFVGWGRGGEFELRLGRLQCQLHPVVAPWATSPSATQRASSRSSSMRMTKSSGNCGGRSSQP